jgi:osmotically-inducible protein OsmY
MRNIHLNPAAALVTASAIILSAGLPIAASELDARIESTAKSSYNFKTYLKDDSIKVASSAGVVTLTGSVSEDYHKALAQETVAGLPGVKSVNNLLTVSGTQPTEHSDAWISLKVKAALAFHQNVRATGTEVNTVDGVVTLTGSANSDAQKELTGEYAKDVEGVTAVRNQLIVNGAAPERTLGEKVDDVSITAQIKTSLLFHKSTHALATKVATQNGVVTLRGAAANAAEKALVTKLAEDIKGVKQVDNQMAVNPS